MSPKADALNPEKQQCTSDGPFFPTENLSREYLYLIQFFVYQFYFDKIEGSCLSWGLLITLFKVDSKRQKYEIEFSSHEYILQAIM